MYVSRCVCACGQKEIERECVRVKRTWDKGELIPLVERQGRKSKFLWCSRVGRRCTDNLMHSSHCWKTMMTQRRFVTLLLPSDTAVSILAASMESRLHVFAFLQTCTGRHRIDVFVGMIDYFHLERKLWIFPPRSSGLGILTRSYDLESTLTLW